MQVHISLIFPRTYSKIRLSFSHSFYPRQPSSPLPFPVTSPCPPPPIPRNFPLPPPPAVDWEGWTGKVQPSREKILGRERVGSPHQSAAVHGRKDGSNLLWRNIPEGPNQHIFLSTTIDWWWPIVQIAFAFDFDHNQELIWWRLGTTAFWKSPKENLC